ncbi:hypothetical protein [Nocardia nepalensis]|uniref:hypothetical protein n=1 Tax=Nocardia nepalensis TaxID=3375448 RepID=UPI003B67902E
MAGGFYNHYDDPDEFWDDDEPLTKAAKPAQGTPPTPPPTTPINPNLATSPVTANRPAAPWEQPQHTLFPTQGGGQSRSRPRIEESEVYRASQRGYVKPGNELQDSLVNTWKLAGSSFASMQLDRGLLPIRIDLDRHWSRYIQPHEYGTEFLKAYELAIAQELSRILSSRSFLPDGGLDLDCGVPDRRTQLMILLETPRWSEYQDKLDAMIAKNEYLVNGRMLYQGEPAMLMTADRMRINSVTIWSGWAETVDPATLVDELLWCADQVRNQRPQFRVWGDYTRYSVSDLEFQHDQHVRSLLEQVYY